MLYIFILYTQSNSYIHIYVCICILTRKLITFYQTPTNKKYTDTSILFCTRLCKDLSLYVFVIIFSYSYVCVNYICETKRIVWSFMSWIFGDILLFLLRIITHLYVCVYILFEFMFFVYLLICIFVLLLIIAINIFSFIYFLLLFFLLAAAATDVDDNNFSLLFYIFICRHHKDFFQGIIFIMLCYHVALTWSN